MAQSELEARIHKAVSENMKTSRAYLRGGAVLGAGPRAARAVASWETSSNFEYWAARRSLRMWPVQGPDLYEAARDFLVDALKQDPRSIPSRDELTVRIAGSMGRSKTVGEVVVSFPNVSMRDAARSAAFNLAGKKAGIRLEIPDTLRPSLRALESLAYNLKKSNPEMKSCLLYTSPSPRD